MKGPVTERQRTILRCLDDGLTPSQIADALDISDYTLREQTRRLLKRFQCRIPDLPDRARAEGVEF